MGIEGDIRITLHTGGGRVAAVDVASSRPLHAPRIFTRRTPAEVLEALPLVYSLCATAQACAARRACAAALGMAADPAEGAVGVLVDTETVREHTVGVLLGWSEFLGEPAVPAAGRVARFLPAMRDALFPGGAGLALGSGQRPDRDAARRLVDEMNALLETQVFAMAPGRFLGVKDEADLRDWAREEATSAARVLARALAVDDPPAPGVGALPALDDAGLRARLAGPDAEAFIARPDWQGRPAETSSLSRQRHRPVVAALTARRGDGLATRLTARLVELAAIAEGLAGAVDALETTSPVTAPVATMGEGIGQVEAARGRLVHRVELAEGVVSRYQVLAPTEWNFHPEGAVAGLLRGLAFADEDDLRRRAALSIRALDPCVGFELMVTP